MTGSVPTLADWLALLPEPALVLTSAGEVVAVNAAFSRITGNAGADRPLGDLLVPDDLDLGEQLRKWARNKQPVTGALRLRTTDGYLDAGVHAGRLSGITAEGQSPLLLLRFTPRQEITAAFRTLTEQVNALAREVSARRQAESMLLALKDSLEDRVARRTAQLRELAARLIEAEAVERRRLAHALHDNLQQLLVTASLQTDILHSVSDDPAVLNIARDLRAVLQESVAASRSLTLELSPPILHDAGLCGAIPWLARRTGTQHGIDVQVNVDERAEPEDHQTRIALFMAARELLFNIVKHAAVSAATISLRPVEGHRVELRVCDEGRGFDLADLAGRKRGDGFGLFSLRERAGFLGGKMRIESAPGKGTIVEIVVPADGTPPPEASPDDVRPRYAEAGTGNGQPDGRIRVLIADDHQILREGIAEILRDHPATNVVALAADGEEAVALARRHEPDLVVMDVSMPRLSGIEATRMIKAEMPQIAIVGLSMHDSPEITDQMMTAGAASFVRKDAGSQSLIGAILSAADRA